MANKKLPTSVGYFNKEMLAILEKDESRSSRKKSVEKKSSNKKK